VLLAIGEGEWTLPIPIVAGTSGWYFDVEEGLDRMRIRQIGRNELDTMQAVLAYYDAQIVMATACWNMHSVLSVRPGHMMACSGRTRPAIYSVHWDR